MDASGGPRTDRTGLGIGLIVASVVTMALADALVKWMSADLTLWQIYVLRSLFAVPFVVLLGRRAGLRPKSLGWVALRSFLLVAMWAAYYASLPLLSLSVAAVALYTSPLIIALLSAPLIGEPVGARRWAAVFVGFVGVVVILRPGTEAFSWVTLLPILAAVLYALAMILTRSKCRHEAPLVLSLGLNAALLLTGLVASVGLALWDLPAGQIAAYRFVLGAWGAMGFAEWGLLFLLGLMIAGYGAAVARAYQIASPSVVATFDYAYLISAVLWGFLLFAETPDGATVIGMVLIAGAGLLVAAPRRARAGADST